MTPTIRAFTALTEIDDVCKAERAIVAKINTGAIDRYGTVIQPTGGDFRAFEKCPVVLFEHGRDPLRGALPIGKNLWTTPVKTPGHQIIKAKTRFNQDNFSQMLYEAYRDGDMTGWSVSILPSDFGAPTSQETRSNPTWKDATCIYRKWELLEYSAVSVPGNSEALTYEELRSLSRVVARGIPVPIDLKELADRAMSASGGMASGGALVKTEGCDEDEEEDKEEVESVDKSADDPADCEDKEEVEDDEEAEEEAKPKKRSASEDESNLKEPLTSSPDPEPVVDRDAPESNSQVTLDSSVERNLPGTPDSSPEPEPAVDRNSSEIPNSSPEPTPSPLPVRDLDAERQAAEQCRQMIIAAVLQFRDFGEQRIERLRDAWDLMNGRV
jgi:hypothetical protein